MSADRLRVLVESAKRIVFFTGAGISTESGIPDFRSPGTGLWTKIKPIQSPGTWPEPFPTGQAHHWRSSWYLKNPPLPWRMALDERYYKQPLGLNIKKARLMCLVF